MEPPTEPTPTHEGKPPEDVRPSPDEPTPDKPAEPKKLSRRKRLEARYTELKHRFDKMREKYSCEQIGSPCTTFQPMVDRGFQDMIGVPSRHADLERLLKQYAAVLDERGKALGMPAEP